ncbi:MAG: TlpA family protein disulfide reductase [Flavobacteriales bacterium]|nr:TlpA family protein disulfide reductase [Flavobacteriales bacterium]
MKYSILYLIIVSWFFSCNKNETPVQISGVWLVKLHIDEQKELPFFLEIVATDSGYLSAIWNGNEKLVQPVEKLGSDSILIKSAYFNSELRLHISKDMMNGVWQDFSRDNYTIWATAKKSEGKRFIFENEQNNQIDGKWEVWFGADTAEKYKAVGLFATDEQSTKGTFITESGDYRFLEGGFDGKEFKVSAFDGSHAFLFEASMINDTLKGWFYSGKHWKEPFVAWKNTKVELKNPYTLSELSNPDKPVDFQFIDLNGSMISLSDEQFRNKPVLVQIMGSWCPNCLDESVYLRHISGFLDSMGVKIVALTFERKSYEESLPTLKKLVKNIGINYPVLYAGLAKKEEVSKSVPWLKEINSYPTLLYLTADKKVFRIHTGFYGPGTGKYFEQQSIEMINDIQNLVTLSKNTTE